jgi:hypothetical protein
MAIIAMVTILRMLKDSPTSLEMLAMLLLPKPLVKDRWVLGEWVE